MNIYSIPEYTGVSVATVSRVLNDNPNVSEKTREKVPKVMDGSGHTSNMFTRDLRLNTVRTIGVVRLDLSDPYLAGAIYYLERGLRSRGYDAILYCTGYDLDAKQKCLDLLRSKRVDVIILAGSKLVEMRVEDNAYIIGAASDLPIMPVNGSLEGENIYNTICDDHMMVYGTANQLLSYGRRRILYVYTSYPYSGVSRLAGYRGALKAKGIMPFGELIRQCPKDIETVKELPLSLHREGLEFDAAITSDDSLAVGAVKYTHIAGIPILRGLSIIGYNNSLLARYTNPGTISIDSRVEALCAITINTLMGVFSGVNVPSRTTVAFDSTKRETTNF